MRRFPDDESMTEEPAEQYSDPHREAMKARFQALTNKLMAGTLEHPHYGYTKERLADETLVINRVGKQPYVMRIDAKTGKYHPYGYMTKAELAAPSVRMPVKRNEPSSFKDKWERENGRSYYYDPTEDRQRGSK